MKEVLYKTPNWIITWGNTIFLLFIGLLLLLSWLIKYPDVILSEAIITSSNPSIKIIAQNNGKIQHLFISENEIAKENKWLCIIENTADYKDVLKLKEFLLPKKTLLNDSLLFKSVENLKYPNLNLGEIQQNYNDFLKAAKEYGNFIKNRPQLVSNEYNQQRLKKYYLLKQELFSQKKLASKKQKLLQEDYDRNLILFKKGVISKKELENKEITLLEQQQSLKNIDSELARLETEVNLVLREASGLSMNDIEFVLEYQTNLVNSYYVLIETIDNWEQKYVLKSPIEGRVNFFNFWSKNQFVKQGDNFSIITPITQDTVFARVKIPIQNAGKIKKDQQVLIKLNSYPFEEYGVILGKIKQITSVSDNNFYTGYVLLENGLSTTYDKELELKNELLGNAEIVTENLRLIERFFYKIIKQIK
ncbi:HlyD family efflux transporter periplasmic adaptor subunit [Aquimarina latercula]|uniref:HlyD family efflux transporter periplasmic adaptor subunit n=1 Tax=Aquimarina latercula TaxID=987 RepID=UPI00138AD6C2|nr:HlyD family efflux transporter periplasmic adaptor subunit [Aquimarina latercula]